MIRKRISPNSSFKLDDYLTEILSNFLILHTQSEQECSNKPNYIRDFPFPEVENKLFSQVSSTQSEEVSTTIRLQPVAHLFHFDYNLLQKFLDDITEEKQLTLNSPIVIYYLILGWLAEPNLSEYIQYFVEFIEAIMLFKHVLNPPLYYYIITNVCFRFFDVGLHPFPNHLIQKIFTEFNRYNFDITLSVLNHSVLNRDNQSTQYLCDLLINSISQNPSDFGGCDFQILVSTFYQSMCDLNQQTMTLLSTVGTLLDRSLMDAVCDLPAVLSSKFAVPVPETPSPDEGPLGRLDDSSDSIQRENSDTNELRGELTPIKPNMFDTSLSLDSILTEEAKSATSSITTFLSQMREEYTAAFFSSFVESCNNSIFPSFLQILLNIRTVVITDKIFLKLFIAFQPGVGAFIGGNLDCVNLYRKIVLQILSIHSPSHICKLLQFNERHPLLFADIIGRIQIKLANYDLNMLCEENTLITVMKVSSTLSTIGPSYDQEAVRSARSTLYLFMFAILENSELAKRCFGSPLFASGFLSRLIEPALTQPIVDSIRSFLAGYQENEAHVLQQLAGFVCGILGVIRSLKDDERVEVLATSILECVNDSIAHNKTIACHFYPVVDSATALIIARPSSSPLTQIFNMCTQIADNTPSFHISHDMAVLMSAALRAVGPNYLTEVNISMIMSVMSRSRVANKNTLFIIQEPSMVLVYFSAVRGGEMAEESVKCFTKLCHHSLKNCRACHQAELDLLLLESLKHNGQKFEFAQMSFELELPSQLVFPLVTTIASVESSPQIANAILSIVAPTEDKTFSVYAEAAMKETSNALMMRARQPKIALPLGYRDRTISFEGIKGSSLPSGFTMQFWLQIDGSAAQLTPREPIIFSLQDEQINFRLHISGTSIICNIFTPSGLSYAALATNFPSCQWILATLVVSMGQPQTTVTFLFNEKQQSTFTVRIPKFAESGIRLVFGGVASNEESPAFEANLGDFWFYGDVLDRRQISELNNLGARASDVSVLALIYYPSSLQMPGITLRKNGNTEDQRNTLLETLANKLTDFVPLFNYIDGMPSHYPEQLIDLLQCIISVSHGEHRHPQLFSMISTLLLKAPPSKLTYSLYHKLFSIIEGCPHSSVIEELVPALLFNAELWCAADGSHLNRIVQHWSTALFNACPTVFMNAISPSKIFVIMRIYFWYTPIETEIIKGAPGSPRPRPANIDIDQCRQYLSRLVFAVAIQKFTLRDSITLISHCSTCSDPLQVINLMKLFSDIVDNTHHSIKIPAHIASLIYHQFKPNSEERFVTALKLLYKFGEEEFAVLHTQPILEMMTPIYVTDQLFDRCVGSLPFCPLLFPICAHLAVNLDRIKEFSNILSEIPINPENAAKVVKNPMWSLWLVLMVVHCDELIVQDQVIQFMCKILRPSAKSGMIPLDDAIVLLDFVAFASDFSVEDFERSLLTMIGQIYLEHSDTKLTSGVVKRLLKALLFRVNGSLTSEALQTVFDESPYSIFDVGFSFSQQLRLTPIKTSADIRNIFFDSIGFTNFMFGFRLGYDGRPVDKELFRVTLECLKSVQNPDEEIRFWKRQLLFFTDVKSRSETVSGELLTFVPHYYDVYNQRFILALLQFQQMARRGIKANEERFVQSMLSMREKEVALSSNDVDLYLQELVLREKENNRTMRHIARRENGWKQIAPEGVIGRDFCFCAESAQPRLRIRSNKEIYPNVFLHKPEGSQFCIECIHRKIAGDDPSLFVIKDSHADIIKSSKSFRIPLEDVKKVLIRKRLHRPTCLEFMMRTGRSFLVDFAPNSASTVIKELIKKQVHKVQQIQPSANYAQAHLMQKWADGYLTNFEYLMKLNLAAGRTFHDASLYPIFPWVIGDFESETLNFAKPGTFRDLNQSFKSTAGFMFMTAPSFPAAVRHFLGGVKPFDSIQSPEPPQNTFGGLQKMVDDVKRGISNTELPPEAFFGPQYFENAELPKWAKTPMDFVYANRRALESPEVTRALPRWIDTIFGSLQTMSVNPVLYENIWRTWPNAEEGTIEATLLASGHMPPMLFQTPHPPRIPKHDGIALQVPFNFYLDRGDLDSAFLVGSDDVSAMYIGRLKDSRIVRITVNIESPQRSSSTILQQRADRIIKIRGGVVAVQSYGSTLSIVTPRSVQTFSADVGNAQFAAGSKRSAAFCGRDGVVRLFDPRRPRSVSVCASFDEDYVCALELSEPSGVVITASENGRVSAATLAGLPVFCADIGSPARAILCTPLWGFTLAAAPGELVLIGADGGVIRRASVDFKVSAWDSWSEDGADFVVVVDDKGRVRAFEAYSLAIGDPFFNCRCPVISTAYVKRIRAFSLITADGHCRILPRSMSSV